MNFVEFTIIILNRYENGENTKYFNYLYCIREN